ncbi:DNA-binding protein [candidate division WOR-1 bacterium RIFOXYA12_FULL_43_27]|uniref:DNA-binding protein n=1 Tax=candidate division WOR-1 bacterium RIFOXYC2_FULL_46_14 TaxID=1802587 RepID=A0A1F4U6I1_UNCSA|nr:MAG: DNA-binding protein [candidate division WOR-1 bacterium RIFOXYA12_FULL_43_27]OGC19519.1 MAG: DNA-binding protein [candidate division WOR-1 bacterium RIFOXYB2_FULL_46_45]OGC30507.1 MAG: DNA-binding protein [candidate division WOR-1 bacterium RIFOXYA2_FULL_46_56]OGC40575.1 MAG: DNA-binding protein [candidate division WOR-1 bacterium RIFOXYC2_FULL_46_14]
MTNLVPIERIENKIYLIRGQKVMLDRDLAELYGVETKALNQAVKRNTSRFPDDFMFQLNKAEFKNLKFQFGTSNLRSQFVTSKKGGRRYFPYVFTEQGIAMLSSVLKSERAVQVNIAIMRAFVRLRKIMATHKDLAQKVDQLENKFEKRLKKNEVQIQQVFEAIRKLIEVESKPKGKFGFVVE